MNFIVDGPSEKQKRFLRATERYVCFGGARGGGKSWAVRTKAELLCVSHPNIRIMIVRRTYPELYSNHITPLLAHLPEQFARYSDARKEFVFFNNARLMFRYCACDSDLSHFQGLETDVLFVDEATQFTEEQFRVLCATVRGVNDLPKRVYLTCNPGGIGHRWVKRLFIDRNFADNEKPEEYVFIPATVYDNDALMAKNPGYLDQLNALPHKLRRAWLKGDWNVFEGQFFEDFVNDPEHYEDRLYTNVIAPFEIPAHWGIFRSFDFGYAKPFSCAWWAIDPDGVAYRILELYGCTQTPNEGVRWTPDRIFSEISRMESEHRWLKGKMIYGVADPAIWDSSRGESIADVAAKYHLYFQPGDNKRIAGWMQVHRRLAFDRNGNAMLYVFNTCRAFLRTVPLLRFDDRVPEDLNSADEDHVADETRYLCMARRLPARMQTNIRSAQ